MNCGERRAHLQADKGGLACAKRTALPHHLVERFTANELGPETNAAVMFLGTVHLNDVLVSQPGEATSFVHQPGPRARGVDLVLVQQLQRHVAVELGIPRAINVARCACTDVFEKDESSPPAASRCGCGGRDVAFCSGDAAVESGDALHEPEVAQDASVTIGSARLCGVPIDRSAVRYRCSEVRERAIVSPQRA